MPVLALNVLKNNNPINFARAIPYNRQRPVCSLEDDTYKKSKNDWLIAKYHVFLCVTKQKQIIFLKIVAQYSKLTIDAYQ